MNKKQLVQKLQSIREDRNKGQIYERDIIGHLEKRGMGKIGQLSKRGNDAFVSLANGKEYKLSIKADDAAAGQMQFAHSREKGWHYRTKDAQGQGLVDAMHNYGGSEAMQQHFGNPKTSDRDAQINHVKKVGELHLPIDVESHHDVAHILHSGTNQDDLMHIKGKGTYAMTPAIAKETGIDYIGDRIDMDADPLNLRHRAKTHSSEKPGKKANRSMTAELNFNKDSLEASDHSIMTHGFSIEESTLLEHIPLDDEEGGMAVGELKTSAEAANEIAGMLQTNTQLEAWVQSKITKAKDYLVSVRDYLKSNPDAKE